VTVVAGASSRTKILEVEGADPAMLSRLLAGAGAGAGTGSGTGSGYDAGPGRT